MANIICREVFEFKDKGEELFIIAFEEYDKKDTPEDIKKLHEEFIDLLKNGHREIKIIGEKSGDDVFQGASFFIITKKEREMMLSSAESFINSFGEPGTC